MIKKRWAFSIFIMGIILIFLDSTIKSNITGAYIGFSNHSYFYLSYAGLIFLFLGTTLFITYTGDREIEEGKQRLEQKVRSGSGKQVNISENPSRIKEYLGNIFGELYFGITKPFVKAVYSTGLESVRDSIVSPIKATSEYFKESAVEKEKMKELQKFSDQNAAQTQSYFDNFFRAMVAHDEYKTNTENERKEADYARRVAQREEYHKKKTKQEDEEKYKIVPASKYISIDNAKKLAYSGKNSKYSK